MEVDNTEVDTREIRTLVNIKDLQSFLSIAQQVSGGGSCTVIPVLHLFNINSLVLYLFGLRVFEFLGFVYIKEEVPQQTLRLAQLV